MAWQEEMFPYCAVLLLFVTGCAALPELQTSVEWRLHRSLYEYKTYGAVTMEIINIPTHPVLVTINSSVESSSSSCPLTYVKIFCNQFGVPVVSRNGETFPEKVFVSKTPVPTEIVASDNQSVVWHMENMKAGPLFIMAVLPRIDTRIKQKGLQRECLYYINLQVSVAYHLETDIYQLGFNQPQLVAVSATSTTLLTFRVPVDSSSYTVDIYGCDLSYCSVNASVFETLSIDMKNGSMGVCQWINGSCRLEVTSPTVNNLNYVSLSADVNLNLTVMIVNLFCTTNHSLSNYYVTTKDTYNCTFVGALGRETPRSDDDTSNFNDRFTTWDRTLSPLSGISLRITDTTVMVTRFLLRLMDSGTSLNVYLHLPSELTSQNSSLANVSLCLSAHRLHHPSHCNTGTVVNASTLKENSKDYIIIPYPQGGHWYISLIAHCYHVDGKRKVLEPCMKPVIANVTVRLSPCIDGSCSKHGLCKLYVESDFLFSACNCFAGWQGYGCNDDSRAVDTTQQILGVYLLTLSNLFFIPGIILTVYRQFYVEALIYSYNMFFSIFYHACDGNPIYQLCILPYNALSFADFFASLLSFWVTLMAMARISQGVRSFLHMLSALFISLGEVYNRHGLLEQLMPIATGLVILLVSWTVESYRRKALFPSKRRLLWFILPGVALTSLGLVTNLAFQTDTNYMYTHSLWHVLVSVSIIFLLPPGKKHSGTPGNLSVQSGDITRQSVLESQEFQANILHALDAVVADGSIEAASPPATPRNSAVGLKLLSRHRSLESNSLVL